MPAKQRLDLCTWAYFGSRGLADVAIRHPLTTESSRVIAPANQYSDGFFLQGKTLRSLSRLGYTKCFAEEFPKKKKVSEVLLTGADTSLLGVRYDAFLSCFFKRKMPCVVVEIEVSYLHVSRYVS